MGWFGGTESEHRYFQIVPTVFPGRNLYVRVIRFYYLHSRLATCSSDKRPPLDFTKFPLLCSPSNCLPKGDWAPGPGRGPLRSFAEKASVFFENAWMLASISNI